VNRIDRANIFDLNLLFITLLDVRRAKSSSLISTSKFKGRCIRDAGLPKGFESSYG